jgi:WD40 repeat protein
MPALVGVTNVDDQKIVELAVNGSATRILAKAKKQICLFDSASGQVLQTIQRTTPLWHRTSGTEGMYISPDARVVATWSDAVNSAGHATTSISFQNAETGQALSTTLLDPGFYVDDQNVVFSSEGSTLLVCGSLNGKTTVLAISVLDGTMKTLPVPGKPGVLEILVPCPGRTDCLASWRGDRVTGKRPSKLSVIDFAASVERPLQSVDIEPWRGLWDRRVAVSPDGRLALVQDNERNQCGHFEVADVQADQLVFTHAERDVSFPRGCFTPDGQRLVVVRGPHYVLLHFGGPPNSPFKESVPATIQLYQISSQTNIAECTPPACPETLVISGDGNTLCFSHGNKVYSVRFRDAFRLDSLPALSRLPDVAYTAR